MADAALIRLGNVDAELVASPVAKAIAKKFLSYRPQGYVFSPAYKAHRWDGWRTVWREANNMFPAGLAWDVAKHLHAAGYEVELRDVRGPAPVPVLTETMWQGKITLDEHQTGAINAIRRATRGVVHQAVSAGKSIEIVEAVRDLGVPTLVLVGRKELLRQQVERFLELGFRKAHVGALGDGSYAPALITVATVQTLTRRLKDITTHADTMNVLANFQAVMIDECHHLPATSYGLLMKAMPNAYYRIGFSATPHKSGASMAEMRLLVTGLTGPVISYHTPSDNIAAGRSVRASIFMVESPGRDPDEIDGYVEYTNKHGQKVRRAKYNYQLAVSTGIVNHDDRNQLVAQLAEAFGKHGPTIVLTERIEHGRNLRQLLLDAGMEEVK